MGTSAEGLLAVIWLMLVPPERNSLWARLTSLGNYLKGEGYCFDKLTRLCIELKRRKLWLVK
jgi:hypothetical protein